MKLTLKSTDYSADGIWGRLLDESGDEIAFTLEHSYSAQPGAALAAGGGMPMGGQFLPKLPRGATYVCVLGSHQLEGMAQPFQTYEITGVTGHSNILFHSGNKNSDSAGCVLLGTAIGRGGTTRVLSASRTAFEKFMQLTNHCQSFELEVV